jgi:creatinine amidohydrolase/Fe(II)-dependent formamide hydrolase-like protein
VADLDALRRQLHVFERVEVGPVRIEARRLRVPYTVVRDGESTTRDLTLRWADDVLDPATDARLASLIGVQVALNYALFCDELVLHGPFDKHDRAFLTEMAHNTACEIWVHKLRKPNPFLVDGALQLQPVDDPAALAGALVFPESTDDELRDAAFGGGTAVLASGGKDSLLTQGVCEELGLAPHALFANESGRHWYTALNAWRHLSATRPERTARVWIDCDRMYTWFLRQMPFIRPDFAELRADDYPIRLWTVAVFLFATLPMARRRGAGRMLVGDEWDCTQVGTYEGVRHYGGYYDQSRFFDERLTRFFHRRGYNLTVMSLLRPLSELLIEDVLSARYPELFAQQVSCHAASVKGERVLPCGRCEKCRRIVGMLVALGRDPSQLGYDEAMVSRCLTALASKGAKQAEDGQHLAAMLVAGGHIDGDSPFAQGALRHPGTERLRFDPLCSPPTVLPVELRHPVWTLFAEHAAGCVEQRNGVWVTVDPLVAPWARDPHAHEAASVRSPAEAWPAGHPVHRWGELTWPQAGRRLREVDTALLPVGAVEQHGPHLPLDIDAWDAAHQCEQVAAACTDPKPLVLPLIPYGVSYHHDDFPGTISVSPETLSRMVYEVGMAAARNGIRKLIIVNGHGGNSATLHYAAQLINRDAAIFTTVDTGETSDKAVGALLETGGDAHAGEYETSTALSTRPHLVFLEHARTELPQFDSPYLDFDSDRSVEWYVRTQRISETGTLGDPTLASAEKGRQIWKLTIDSMVELVEHLKGTPLAALHRGHDHRDI